MSKHRGQDVPHEQSRADDHVEERVEPTDSHALTPRCAGQLTPVEPERKRARTLRAEVGGAPRRACVPGKRPRGGAEGAACRWCDVTARPLSAPGHRG